MTEKEKNKSADNWLEDLLYPENMDIKDIPKNMRDLFRRMYKAGYSDGVDTVERKINDLLSKIY